MRWAFPTLLPPGPYPKLGGPELVLSQKSARRRNGSSNTIGIAMAVPLQVELSVTAPSVMRDSREGRNAQLAV
jgi:hypothetical protein